MPIQMDSQYVNDIVRNITVQRNINKFRHFMYSLNKDTRQVCFRITKEFLEKEYNNLSITSFEKERLLNLQNHWQWSNFDTDSCNWWSELSLNHSRSTSLIPEMSRWTADHTYSSTYLNTARETILK
jgi:hypothetical protein